MTEKEIDAAGDGSKHQEYFGVKGFYFFPPVSMILMFPSSYVLGDVLVILDLRADDSLFESGAAREVEYKLLLYEAHIAKKSISTTIFRNTISILGILT